jgi:hypothetical protein
MDKTKCFNHIKFFVSQYLFDNTNESYMVTIRTLLIIGFGLTFTLVPGQSGNKLIIATTIDKGDYFYIPKAALADSVQAVLYQDKMNKKVSPINRPIKMYWVSTCNDGYYNLTITPQQIFFSSTHDNPNPDILLWAIDIEISQFEQIKTGFKQMPPNGFKNLSKNHRQSLTVFYDDAFKDTFSIPDEWTDVAMNKHSIYCKAQINSQLEKYLSIINSYIVAGTQAILVPTRIKRKYFSDRRQEFYDWTPIKFTPPKVTIDE